MLPLPSREVKHSDQRVSHFPILDKLNMRISVSRNIIVTAKIQGQRIRQCCTSYALKSLLLSSIPAAIKAPYTGTSRFTKDVDIILDHESHLNIISDESGDISGNRMVNMCVMTGTVSFHHTSQNIGLERVNT